MNKELFLNTFLQNNSLNMLTEQLSSLLNCPIIITDNAFHIVSSFAAKNYFDEEYQKAVSHSELGIDMCGAITAGFSNCPDGRITLTANGKTVTVSELKCTGVSLGYIIYIINGNNRIDNSDINFAESLVAKQFLTDRRSGGLAPDSASELLVDLLDGKFESEDLFNLKIAGTFLAHYSPKKFAVIELNRPHSTDIADRHILNTLTNNFKASHPFFYKGNIIIFLHADHDEKLLSSVINEYNLKAIVSDNLPCLFMIKTKYRYICELMKYLSSYKSTPFVANYNDYSLLMLLKTVNLNNGYMDSKIEKLYLYDLNGGKELCLTLYTYIISGHSLSVTGEQLFTHRNTVQYRIKKIKDDFGIDPDCPKMCVPYLLSLSLALVRLGEDRLFIK